MAEPNWIDIAAVGDSYDVQIDANSGRKRHRRLNFERAVSEAWRDGPPPEDQKEADRG